MWLVYTLVGCAEDKPADRVDPIEQSPTPGETTPQPPGEDPCAREIFDESGGSLEAEGVTVEIPVDSVSGPVEVVLCPAEAPEGFELSSLAWEVTSSEDLPWPLPITITYQGDSSALFLPSPTGSPAHAITASLEEGTAEGLLYRSGVFFTATDTRALALYEGSGAVDLLFVVDNSATMADQQLALADSFPLIYDLVLERAVDYHIGFTSTDLDGSYNGSQGKLREVAGVRWIDPTTPDPETVFGDMAQMGTTGSALEKGLGAAYLALETLASDFNAGFLRDGIPLVIVTLSDEDDWTPEGVITPDGLSDYLLSLEASRPLVSFNLIGSGSRYLFVRNEVGGFTENIGNSWESFFLSVFDEIDYIPFVLDPGASAAPEVWAVPADGGEQRLIPAESVSYDPITQGVVVDPAALDTGDVVWLLYETL